MKSKNPLSPVDYQRVCRAIAIVLLPLLIADTAPRLKSATHRRPAPGQDDPEPGRDDTHPYLTVIGPAPLRFAPEPVYSLPKAAPPAPPPPAVPEKENAIEAANKQAANKEPEVTTSVAPAVVAPKPKSQNDALPIIPDDTRRQVRPEDILPFFSFPTNGQSGGVIIGTPLEPQQPRDKLPLSSATYIQK